MYDHELYKLINRKLETDPSVRDNSFYTRFLANASLISALYNTIYKDHPNGQEGFDLLLQTIIREIKAGPPYENGTG
jgi:hypothetical protein